MTLPAARTLAKSSLRLQASPKSQTIQSHKNRNESSTQSIGLVPFQARGIRYNRCIYVYTYVHIRQTDAGHLATRRFVDLNHSPTSRIQTAEHTSEGIYVRLCVCGGGGGGGNIHAYYVGGSYICLCICLGGCASCILSTPRVTSIAPPLLLLPHYYTYARVGFRVWGFGVSVTGD